MKKTIKCAAWTSEGLILGIAISLPGIRPGRSWSGHQTNSKLVKIKPNEITGVGHLSAEAENTVLSGRIYQTLKAVEGNVAGHEAARPADVRFDRHEYSRLQTASRHGHGCLRCPLRLGRGSCYCA
jgi:hypothetical protein